MNSTIKVNIFAFISFAPKRSSKLFQAHHTLNSSNWEINMVNYKTILNYLAHSVLRKQHGLFIA